MATPLVASPRTQRYMKLSTSQAPLRNPAQQPASQNELSALMMPINTDNSMESVNNVFHPTRWAYLQGLWAAPTLDMQPLISYGSAYALSQSFWPLNPMSNSRTSHNMYPNQVYGGSTGYQPTHSSSESFISTGSASSGPPRQHETYFHSFQACPHTSSEEHLTSFASTISKNASPMNQLPFTGNSLEPLTKNSPRNLERAIQEHDAGSRVAEEATTSVASSKNDINELAKVQRSKQPTSRGKATSKRKATFIVEEKDPYKVSRIRTKFSVEHPEADFLVWKPQAGPRVKSQQERASATRTRRLKACNYHRGRHEKCDPSCRPYVKCSNVPRVRLVFQTKPEAIILFRPCPSRGHPLVQRDEVLQLHEIGALQSWASGVHLTLTQGLGTYLDVYVSSFAPTPGDQAYHIWYQDGQRQVIGMPNYCIGPLHIARAKVKNYIRQALSIYGEDIFENSSGVVREVLSYASQHAKKHKSTLVDRALHLLAVSRMIERDWHIHGPNTLGIRPVPWEDCPWFGKVPVTPMMDTQLDQIVIQDYLIPLRDGLLSELQEKMYDENADSLFDIFLVVFILATNMEWLLRHSRRNAKRYNAKHRYNSTERAQTYFDGHNVLMAHFHHLCRGSNVSATVSNAYTSSGSTLSEDQLEFITSIREKILAQKEHLQQIRREKRYEAELYWSQQMFFDGWEPESMQVIDEVENA